MVHSLVGLLVLSMAATGDADSTAKRDVVIAANAKCSITFSRKTGELLGIRNVPLNDPVLKGSPSFGTPFRIHTDFSGEWLLNTDAEKAAQTHLGPEGLAVTNVRRSMDATWDSLHLTYTGGGLECVLRIALEFGTGDSTWTLSVKNTGTEPRDFFVEFPRFEGVQPGSDDAKRKQTVLNQAGWIGEAWKGGGGIYGNGGQWSMQWHALFDPASHSSFGFIVMDPELRNKRLALNKPRIAIQYFPPKKLAPGETVALPPVWLSIRKGDWKHIAKAYAVCYEKPMPHAEPPQWFRESDLIDGEHFKKKGKNPADQGLFVLDDFRQLPAAVIQSPFDNTEYAFWSRGSMLHGVHTDGDNLVREDLGGVAALREGFAGVRKLGLHSTLYIEGYIVHKESDLAKSGKAERWSVMHRDGTIGGPYTNQGFLHMCPGCVEWQDHLVSLVTRALRECGADGVRLDSLGFYFLPCYNPAHKHGSPFDYNVWIQQLLAKVRDAALKIKPDALLTTEAPVDFYGQWFHGALTQTYAAEISPMRLALAPYRAVAYTQAGSVWGSLSGFAGGRDDWGPNWNSPEANWLSARAPVHDILVWGNVADDSPQTNDNDIITRRFMSNRGDAIVAARVSAKGDHWPGGVRLSDRRKPYEMLIRRGGAPPETIAVCDIETLSWQSYKPAVRDRCLVVSTESNWILVVIPRAGNRVVTFDPLPQVRPGQEATIRPTALTGDATGEVEIWAPGLLVGQDGCQSQVRLGESLTIRTPNDALPGWYQVRVRGKDILGVKRLLHVVKE